MRHPLPLAILIGLMAIAAAPASAREVRPFCPDRPGLGTTACVTEPGHVQLETGLAGWTLDRQADTRTDMLSFGETVLRVGVGKRVEARIGWTAWGRERIRDRATRAVERESGVGDVTLGIKRGLINPDGSGLSVAVLPFATLPVGRGPAADGDWSGGLLVPIAYSFGDSLQLEFTPEVDAAVDEDGNGRHLAYSAVVGATGKVSDSVSAVVEYQALRDRDPSGHETQHLAAVALEWQPRRRLQLDIGSTIGINRAAPDVNLYIGVARKF